MKSSVKVKVLAPVTLLALLAVMISLFSILSNLRMKENTQELKEISMVKLKAAVTLNENIQELQKVLLQHCVNDAEIILEGYEEKIEALYEESEAAMAEFKQVVQGDPENAATAETLENAQKDMFDLHERIVILSAQGEKQDAITMTNGQLAQKASIVESGLKEIEEQAEAEIAEATEAVAKMSARAVTAMGACIAASIVLSVGAVILCMTRITKPIEKMNHKLVEIAEDVRENRGNLTERVPVVSKDEIGTVAKNINHFIETLQEIMSEVIGGSQELERVTVDVNENMRVANDSVNDTSAIMEELAASMEEIAATIADINGNMTTVDNGVVDISATADSIKGYAGDMKQRAQKLEQDAQASRNRTQTMTEEMLERLNVAIQNSKSVERVNELTNEILNISSQTNLLALNASIEAARAGDAGRGFAVVADEIRQLADNSRATANDIQQINAAVVQAVRDLGANSQEIVEYLQETILPDYNDFVEVGQKYSGDAVYLDGEMRSFYELTEELKKLIQTMTSSITGITAAIDDSANGVGTAAESATKLAEEIKSVNERMEISNAVADKLKKQAGRFVAV